ncbi:unnamed protein product [Eruca vesicaria subsp. sativa]|uniref:non-specific serine/threonine protein kinase n=1 Tax=Eruca vesicaria subsp. sativa TaxID=29727 RepID=A0ABC8JHN1_ERUVS|nr:unnamed protein product [Eruca vesicaria subsp. sativa]
MEKSNRDLALVTTLLILLKLCSIVSCTTSTSITRNHAIRDGDSLISGVFELGFFSPKDSTSRYVGIWYKNIQPRTVVWVANREKPLSDQNGALKIADDGNLVIVNGRNNIVWSTDVPLKLNNTVAILLEAGDLVLSSDSDMDTRYWESFNNPTDTFLPGMRVWVNPSMGENHAFIPWKSETDPSPGRYSMGIDPFGAIEIVIWEGETRKWRSGPWNSAIFTGVPDMFPLTNYIYGFKLSSPPDPDGSVYITYVPSNKDDILRFQIRYDGIVEQLRWNRVARKWASLQVKPSKECEKYNRCGNYSVCNDSKDFNSGKCNCIYGFEPAYRNQWNNRNFSGGCKRKVSLNCRQSLSRDKVDRFMVLKGMKVPDFGSVVSINSSSGTCKDVCLRDCSCNAYEVVPGIGCMIWTRDLVDMEHFEHGGNSINIRLAASEIDFLCKKKNNTVAENKENRENIDYSVKSSDSLIQVLAGDQVDTPDLPTFSFNSVASATGDFSEENKLGQGGFGTVYKGNFSGGREMAVKRLSGKSKQGIEEFKNEILLIAKLQHRNLVRLLGCCIENDEKILLYEYMPNNSLDRFLLDESKRRSLEWRKRWDIIGGIARGLLYLHRDSRLKIIHRDLKASNILLDTEMNPKISDFGTARIFNYRQDQANTIRVVGTYGYMAPEYAMEGIFSDKTDVYSFGVLILEIVSGSKNVSFRGSEHRSLIGYVSLFIFTFVWFVFFFFISRNVCSKGQNFRHGDSLISKDKVFELGFFSPKDLTLRYVGIWYKNIQPRTIVWVANREKPLSDHKGALKIADDGNLVIVNGGNNIVWSTNVPLKLNNTVAILLEAGDLVLSSDSDRDTRYWASFNNPTDTFLPGMRVWVNPSMGENRAFIPWKSETDPSPGRYSMGIDPFGAIEIVIWEGERRKWRSGPWNSAIFTGVPDMFNLTNYIHGFKLSSPPDPDGSVFFTYVPSNKDDILRFRIRYDGIVEQLRWNRVARKWASLQVKPSKECEKYNRCGNYSVCNDSKDFDSGKCSCIYGFDPVYRNQWNNGNYSGGCKRRVSLNCRQSLSADGVDGFRVLKGMKVPDFGSVVSINSSSGTCKDVCLRDCSCNAYKVIPGIGCMIWTRDLIDMEQFEHGGNSINIRLAASEIRDRKEKTEFLITVFSSIGAFLLGLCCLCIWILCKFRKRVKDFLRKKKDNTVLDIRDYSVKSSCSLSQVPAEDQVDTPDLPTFSFNNVASATGDFSEENKIGQGGFGTVYKGIFSEGREMAVKRLSGKSKQGVEEFKNEILLIAKLQHRNLVRLLGCCIENDEKILLYEYMPNNSLDRFLFNESKQGSLEWRKRWDIIGGIARGLLYLHRDSRLKIIHRDLKASNILLDKEWKPKISDFGMARIFNYRQDQANTVRVVGTYGYMAPEYAMEGMFSEKSDVYSFGVLILEIVSGRKNVSFRGSEHRSLIGYAWNLWSQGKTKELIDPTVTEIRDVNEAIKCIHVGMLCAQDSVIHRPDMGLVLLMLESQTSHLPRPRQPTFHSFLSFGETVESQDVATVNDITLTTVAGR